MLIEYQGKPQELTLFSGLGGESLLEPETPERKPKEETESEAEAEAETEAKKNPTGENERPKAEEKSP